MLSLRASSTRRPPAPGGHFDQGQLVVALGDSITAGFGVTTPWPTSLGTALGAAYSVTNGGISGNSTSQMLTRWSSTYRPLGPEWLVLLGGHNDFLSEVPAATILANLTAIYDQALADGVHLIPMTTTPWNTYSGWNSTRQAIQDTVNAGILSYCSSHGITCIDLFNSSLNNGTGGCAMCQADGVHPTQPGADYIETLVRARFP